MQAEDKVQAEAEQHMQPSEANLRQQQKDLELEAKVTIKTCAVNTQSALVVCGLLTLDLHVGVIVENVLLYLCGIFDMPQVSGPGLQSATANHPTQVLIELSDSTCGPFSPQQKSVTAELELSSETSYLKYLARWGVYVSPSRYAVSYTAVSRGQYKLHVHVNNREINRFTLTVYPDPIQLSRPMRAITDVKGPYGIAFNSRREMFISERGGHRISVFDFRGRKIRTFGPDQMISPAGIAIDEADNVYVSSQDKLQKFTSSGELIKCVGQKGSREGEFNDPRGITLYDNRVYICDRNNNRIQVFDQELNFIRCISSYTCNITFNGPLDVKFDAAGKMYVAETRRVQVIDINNHCIRTFGGDRMGKLSDPSALHIVDKYMYVSDWSGHCIVVYETSGQFVTSFGRFGHLDGEFDSPYSITSCADGFIYVCDSLNNRVQIF